MGFTPKKFSVALVASTALVLAGCGGSTGDEASGDGGGEGSPLKVAAVYSSLVEEPWDGVIQQALINAQDEGLIEFTYIDDVGYASGAMERTMRQVVEEQDPDFVIGDSFGNEEAARAVAADYPDTPFVFGSGGGPAEPNFSVFDNWIYEPAYLAGMAAGELTETNVLGIVGGIPVPEVNRLINAFILGAQSVNPDVEAKVTYINSWFDPAAAKEAALAQIDAGADVLYAERAGVIEAAQEKGVLAVGNMMDQQAIAPETVITSVIWSMDPTVRYIIDQVSKGSYTSQDLKDFSMVGKGGASLAPLNTGITGGIPESVVDSVAQSEAAIKSGVLRVDINEAQPAGSVVVE
jgi:basic membrane protein A